MRALKAVSAPATSRPNEPINSTVIGAPVIGNGWWVTAGEGAGGAIGMVVVGAGTV
jgi:hypothetical protein